MTRREPRSGAVIHPRIVCHWWYNGSPDPVGSMVLQKKNVNGPFYVDTVEPPSTAVAEDHMIWLSSMADFGARRFLL